MRKDTQGCEGLSLYAAHESNCHDKKKRARRNERERERVQATGCTKTTNRRGERGKLV